ncbi:MAG: hypothetical protein U0270_33245 [Labilithrix sp.]
MMQPPPLSGIGARDREVLRIVCVHADRCGGCPIIALPYGEQLAMKRGRVVGSIARYPALELVYTEPVQAAEPVVEYRTRAKMIVAGGGKLGLYAKGGGHQVVDIPECRVVTPLLGAVAALLRQRIKSDEASNGPLAPVESGGALRAVDLREVRGHESASDEGRVLVTLVVQRDRAGELSARRSVACSCRKSRASSASRSTITKARARRSSVERRSSSPASRPRPTASAPRRTRPRTARSCRRIVACGGASTRR